MIMIRGRARRRNKRRIFFLLLLRQKEYRVSFFLLPAWLVCSVINDSIDVLLLKDQSYHWRIDQCEGLLFFFDEHFFMSSDVILTTNWISRRFFLSTNPSASRLFCCNTVDGFTFGQIDFNDDDQLICQSVNIQQSGFQINQLSWLSNTIFRPSRKQISYVFFSIDSNTFDYLELLSLLYPHSLDNNKRH